ncbi:MAG: antibiotic biosynthesis monooxygenase [Leptolyngbya sp. DLM2.Bin15]|nr:MAG: antibiotic biosynthesis monooxygenase [Leptolyngbya sp. DLM2.Bin15]
MTVPPSDSITVVISELVEPTRIHEYEAWTQGFNQAAQQFDGFLGVEIIRPRDHDFPEYVIIIRFDSYIHLREWLTSPTYHQWRSRSPEFVAARSQQELSSSLELWFTLPSSSASKHSQPAYYKQVILGVIAVYPLILLSNLVFSPLVGDWPLWAALLLTVPVISALLTYPVMPWLTKLFSPWLYPSLSGRDRSSIR